MAKLKTKRGVEIIVDEDIYLKYNRYKWHLSRRKYPHCFRLGYLHHLVIGSPPLGLDTDHINRNTLDNRRENLRHVTRAVNRNNSALNKNSSTGYTGVRYRIYYGWRAVITFDKKRKHLGYFKTAEEASTAYQKAKEKYYGNS